MIKNTIRDRHFSVKKIENLFEITSLKVFLVDKKLCQVKNNIYIYIYIYFFFKKNFLILKSPKLPFEISLKIKLFL